MDNEKRLKLSIHKYIHDLGYRCTPEAYLAITELIFEKFKFMGRDLEAFAKYIYVTKVEHFDRGTGNDKQLMQMMFDYCSVKTRKF
jgi:hypothetical protein